MDLLDRLLEHDHWATTELLTVCNGLSDDQLDQPFDIGHQTVRNTLEHLVVMVESWTALMVRIPPDEQPDDRSVNIFAKRNERIYATFSSLARKTRDANQLDETFTDFYDYPMTFGGGILHVLLHSELHRNDVLHILQRLGLEQVPELDHGLWDFKRRGY